MELKVLKTTTKHPKRKAQCKEGSGARENFENAMKALFQVPKPASKKSPKGKD